MNTHPPMGPLGVLSGSHNGERSDGDPTKSFEIACRETATSRLRSISDSSIVRWTE